MYEYVRASLLSNKNKSNIGCAFTYTKRDEKGKILRIAYRDGVTDKYTAIDVIDAGMYLFRTGIGLFWYEIIINSKDITADWLVQFQYKFKELNAQYNSEVFYKIIKDSVLADTEAMEYDIELGRITVKNKNGEFEKFTACNRFTMGNWVSDIVGAALTNVNKSVYASVSHVQHQNDFYEYVEKQLRIKEDIKSITMGLEALADLQKIRLKENAARERERIKEEKELQEEKKQLENDSLSIGLSVISLFAIFSAFADGIAIIDRLMESNNFSLLNDYSVIIYGIVIVLIVIISVYTIGRLVHAAYRSHRGKKYLKKKEEEMKNEIH